MHIDLFVALAGLIVGFAVGLTGMGGGALMTPILVLVFGIAPLAAVSSDLVASLIMKPVGAAVHAGRGTVRWNLAGLARARLGALGIPRGGLPEVDRPRDPRCRPWSASRSARCSCSRSWRCS